MMGMYICNRCDGCYDSGDGCYEDPENDMKLICPDCQQKIEENMAWEMADTEEVYLNNDDRICEQGKAINRGEK